MTMQKSLSGAASMAKTLGNPRQPTTFSFGFGENRAPHPANVVLIWYAFAVKMASNERAGQRYATNVN